MSLDWDNLETPAEGLIDCCRHSIKTRLRRFSPEVKRHELTTNSFPDRTGNYLEKMKCVNPINCCRWERGVY